MGDHPGRKPVAVLIPAYEPNERLLSLLERLQPLFARIVLVDDGSTRGQEIFVRARPLVETVLVHPVNRGKGCALKTGFAYLGDSADVVTVDSDGQHAPEDVVKVAEALADHRDGLVLGVRAFTGEVPMRSRFGNFWTRFWFNLFTHLHVTDTQTGLRGIPAGLVARVAALPGERFEYEMVMLSDARHHAKEPFEVPIRTIYLDGNVQSHHRPLVDTWRIYKAFARSLMAVALAVCPCLSCLLLPADPCFPV